MARLVVLPRGATVAQSVVKVPLLGWRWVLQDHLAQNLGVLLAEDQELVFARNKRPEARWMIHHDDEVAALLLNEVENGIPILRCFRDERQSDGSIAPVERYSGLVLPFDEDAEEDSTLTVTSLGPFAQLENRYTAAYFAMAGSTDAGAIGWQLVANANAESPIPIIQGSIEPTVPRFMEYQYAEVSQSVTDLTTMDQGFDFEVRPAAPASGTGLPLGIFDVYKKQGSEKPAAAFGHGKGTVDNCTSVGRSTLPPRNRVIVFGDEGVVQIVDDLASQAKYGIWAIQETLSGQTDASALRARGQELLAPKPIKVIRFSPDPAFAPVPGIDYWLGDTVPVEIRRTNFNVSASPRIDGITIKIDESGIETSHEIAVAQAP